MATVIHTRKGKYKYLYEHTREGSKVKTRYMYPVDDEGGKRVAQQGISEYQKLKNEYDRLRTQPTPKNETIDEMIERMDALTLARKNMNMADPEYIKKQREYEREYEEEKKRKEGLKKVYVTPGNIKKNMLIKRDGKLFEIVKVSRVNCYVLPYPSMPNIDIPKKVKIYDLSTYEVYR